VPRGAAEIDALAAVRGHGFSRVSEVMTTSVDAPRTSRPQSSRFVAAHPTAVFGVEHYSRGGLRTSEETVITMMVAIE